MTADAEIRQYVPSPTAKLFHSDDSFVRALAGPVGSGKTVSCCMEVFFRALRVPPHQGVRKSRWLVVRTTFAELKSTTIRTWMEWLGHIGTFRYDSPITFTSRIRLPDKTQLLLEVFFMPLDREEDVKKLRSLEITGVWLNEASLTKVDFTTEFVGRMRYPDEVPAWKGIIMDTNMPTTRHWFYETFEKKKPPGYKLFRQPPALLRTETGEYIPNPEAENVQNLKDGYDYYFRQIVNATQDKINVLVLAEYGAIFSGKPVYDGIYNDREHVSEEHLKPVYGVPLVIGMDFGLTPAAVFGQLLPTGTLNILAEVAPQDVVFEEFLDDYVFPKLAAEFRHIPVTVIGDPAGANRSSMSVQTVFQLMHARGLAALPAISNDPLMRRDAVAHFLQRRGRFLMDPRCTALREGFQGGYRFKQREGGEGYSVHPEKNFSSHIHDALQYLCLHHYKSVTRPARHPLKSDKPRKKFVYA